MSDNKNSQNENPSFEKLKQNEAMFRAIFDNSVDAIGVGKDGLQVRVNSAHLKLFGYSNASEILGKPVINIIAKSEHPRIKKYMKKRAVDKVAPSFYETIGIKKDGTQFDLSVDISTFKLNGDNYSLVILRDITGQKQAENALMESEERYRLLVNNIPNVSWTSDSNGRTTFISPNVEQVYGYTPGEIYKGGEKLWFGRIHPNDLPELKKAYQALFEQDQEFDLEYRIKRKDGRWIWLHDKAIMHFEENQKKYAYGVFSEITRRKVIEKELRVSEDKFAKLFSTSPNIITLSSVDEGMFIDVNDNTIKITGFTREEIIGKSSVELGILKPDDRDHAINLLRKEGSYSGLELPFWTKDKKQKTGLFYGQVIEIRGNNYLFSTIIDITNRKQTEEELADSEIRFKTLSSATFEGIVISDKGKFIDANKQFKDMFGYTNEDLLGKPIMELVAPESKDLVLKMIKTDYKKRYEHLARHRDGTIFPVQVHGQSMLYDGTPVRITAIRNITEQKQAEQKIQAYQKSLKELTAELTLAEERERRELAVTLHDQLGQSLAMAKIKLANVTKSPGLKSQKPIINEVKNYIDQAIHNSRNLTYELSPPVLYDLGLVAAIIWRLQQIKDENKLKTRFIDQSQDYSFDNEIRVLLFRAVNEVLTNVVKHAQATHATVKIKRLKSWYTITVIDNGIGFDVDKITKQAIVSKKFGLFSVSERLEYIKGMLEIRSVVGKGTQIEIKVPVNDT